jgi:hypothetical protein
MTAGEEPAELPSLGANVAGIVGEVGDTLVGWLLDGSRAGDLKTWPNGHWDVATWLSYWQGAVPWLLQRAGEDEIEIPEAAGRRLRKVDRLIRSRTRRILAEAVEVLQELDRASVPVIPLKGVILSATYYPDPESRAMRDIDLLIRQSDSQVVSDVLASLQYRRLKSEPKSTVWARGTNAAETWSPEHLRPIDVHTRSVDDVAYHGFDIDGLLWRNSPPAPLLGVPNVRVLTPAMLLVHVAVHASNNAIRRDPVLSHFRDLAVVGRRLDAAAWDQVVEMTDGAAARILYPSLGLLNRYAPGVVPTGTFQRIEHRATPRLQTWVLRNGYGKLTRTSYAREDAASRVVSVVVARSRLVSGWREWMRFMAGVAFPESKGIVASHRWADTPLWPAAYLQRRIQRVWKVGKAALRGKRSTRGRR